MVFWSLPLVEWSQFLSMVMSYDTFTIVWQSKKVENASGKTPVAEGCNRTTEPSQGTVRGNNVAGWWTKGGTEAAGPSRLIELLSMAPIPIWAIIDIWSCRMVVMGIIIWGKLLIILTWVCNCFKYSITSSSTDALSICWRFRLSFMTRRIKKRVEGQKRRVWVCLNTLLEFGTNFCSVFIRWLILSLLCW